MTIELELTQKIDNLCDYTYDFIWQNNKLLPEQIIPSQKSTNYTFKDLVNELKKGKDVIVHGNVGKRLGYSIGVSLKHFGGSGKPEKAGKLFVDGDVSIEMGMGMTGGIIYVKGNVKEPLGNVIEVVSDEPEYKKFCSITEILCKGIGKNTLIKNSFDKKRSHLLLDDKILRGTIGARCYCDGLITIDGNVYNGTGLLMQKGIIHVKGDAGMNTGAHLDGGIVIVDGVVDEFAGAYMKKGSLILKDTKGFAGANLKDGVIFSKKKIKISPSITELSIVHDDGKMIMKHLGIGHVEAMSYYKYGVQKERLVRMRDGSFVVRQIE